MSFPTLPSRTHHASLSNCSLVEGWVVAAAERDVGQRRVEAFVWPEEEVLLGPPSIAEMGVRSGIGVR